MSLGNRCLYFLDLVLHAPEGWRTSCALLPRGSVLDCGCPLPLLALGPEEPVIEFWLLSISRLFPKRQRTCAVQDLADIPSIHHFGSAIPDWRTEVMNVRCQEPLDRLQRDAGSL